MVLIVKIEFTQTHQLVSKFVYGSFASVPFGRDGVYPCECSRASHGHLSQIYHSNYEEEDRSKGIC